MFVSYFLILFVPVLRLCKLPRHVPNFTLVFLAIRDSAESATILILSMSFIILISTGLIFIVEPRENVPTYGRAVWLTTVTLSTVGYGDIVPYTVAGKFIATLTALMGVCVVALLTGIVATGFTNQVAMRRQQLEAEISSALSDGVITNVEREKIDDLRQRLNITEEDALAIIGYLQRKNDQK